MIMALWIVVGGAYLALATVEGATEPQLIGPVSST